jgi:hypothetical protein
MTQENKQIQAWEVWERSQSGDWRDVRHDESFDAGWEACDETNAVLLDQYRKALESFGVTFADNGFIRKIPREIVKCRRCGAEREDGKFEICCM